MNLVGGGWGGGGGGGWCPLSQEKPENIFTQEKREKRTIPRTTKRVQKEISNSFCGGTDYTMDPDGPRGGGKDPGRFRPGRAQDIQGKWVFYRRKKKKKCPFLGIPHEKKKATREGFKEKP